MLFTYRAIDQDGHEREGTIEAPSQEVAVSALQRRALIVSAIASAEKRPFLQMDLPFFNSVSNKDVVILSRQISTLFEAQVSALRIFRLLASEVDNKHLADILSTVADDLQGGSPISKALARHPKVFSTFYVNMVRAGEESGKLSETFVYLADYLDRSYDVVSKAENALIYPIFVIAVFFGVMAPHAYPRHPQDNRGARRFGRAHPHLHPRRHRLLELPRQLRHLPAHRPRRARVLPLAARQDREGQAHHRPPEACGALRRRPLQEAVPRAHRRQLLHDAPLRRLGGRGARDHGLGRGQRRLRSSCLPMSRRR